MSVDGSGAGGRDADVDMDGGRGDREVGGAAGRDG